jgi:hypothetical protein
MKYFVEVRPAVHRSGPPRLVPLDEIHKHTGFRTIFAYDEETTEFIKEQGGTQGLRGQPVYADTLFLDFDGHDPVEFRIWLQQSGYGYTEWDSGGRSVHFHIPMIPVYGAWVPFAMKKWIKTHAPTADISFVHAAGMYRLPGTWHAKHPGRCKLMTANQVGTRLLLEQATNDLLEFKEFQGDGGIELLFQLLTLGRTEGNRAPHLFRIGIAAAEAGLEFEDALDHMRWWNKRFAVPMRDDITIVNQCQSAYRRMAKRQA